MRNYFERRMDLKIKEKLQKITLEYELSEKRLSRSVDQWHKIPKDGLPFSPEWDRLVRAGDEMAESADDMLKYYRKQPIRQEEK